MIWLQSYLTLRSQYVVVDGCSSSKTTSLHFICEWHIPVSFLLNFIYHPICWWYILLLCPFKSSFEISLAQSNVYILFSWVKSKHLFYGRIEKEDWRVVEVEDNQRSNFYFRVLGQSVELFQFVDVTNGIWSQTEELYIKTGRINVKYNFKRTEEEL